MSNPFDDKNKNSNFTSTEDVRNNNNSSNDPNNPGIQSTLLKRVGGTPMDERYKRFPGEVSDRLTDDGSHCGASPFEVTKNDHSKAGVAGGGSSVIANQTVTLSSNQQPSVSLEKQQPSSSSNGGNHNSNKFSIKEDINDGFVSVPFSPPMRAFSLERSTSNSELPYLNPDGTVFQPNGNNLNSSIQLGQSNDPLLNPGIDRSYYNMNSRIGSSIPLDDENNNDLNDNLTRVTTAVRNSPQVQGLNNQIDINNDEDGGMVNINVNPGTFAEPNGAEVPVVVRRRKNDDTIGVIVMIAVILIIIGGCIAFLFI